MSYTFTQAEINKIQELYTAAENNPADGKYAGIYDHIADLLQRKTTPSGENLIDDASVRPVWLWLEGASQTNANIGPFSTLIREYTRRQGELRGFEITDSQLDDASNAVAEQVIGSILESGFLPSLSEIAEDDARQVGQTLFLPELGEEDSAVRNNAAWSGSVLFSAFGDDVDETGRLINFDGQMDSIDDVKNVLFAVDAFQFAIRPALAMDVGESLVRDLFDSIDIGWTTSFIGDRPLFIGTWGQLVVPGRFPSAYIVLTPDHRATRFSSVRPAASRVTVARDRLRECSRLHYGAQPSIVKEGRVTADILIAE